jgi:hypothetical protein
MKSKLFHLGDVLSITTGNLMSPNGMGGIYGILNFMTSDNLFTHQIGRAIGECAPDLLAQHPALATVEIPEITPENFKAVMEGLCAEYGEELLIEKLPEHQHEFIDAMSELAEKVHPDKIIVARPNNDG